MPNRGASAADSPQMKSLSLVDLSSGKGANRYLLY